GSGCAFDPVDGYRLLLDLLWDPLPGTIPPDIYYYVEVSDGAGRPLILNRGVPQIYTTKATSTRIVECDVHVDASGERRARFGWRRAASLHSQSAAGPCR